MRPILASEKQIIYLGELDTSAKKHWYRHARATFLPFRWSEPLGMVLLESMASGTPILALKEGAVPEIVRHAETGFVVDSPQAMASAVGRIEDIDRANCRKHVDAHFSVPQMAEEYTALYQQLTNVPRFSEAPIARRLPPQRSEHSNRI